LQYIEEEKFLNFFRSNPNDIVHFNENPLNCNNVTPFKWLIQNRDEFRSQLLYATCSNGTSIWDLNPDDDGTTTPLPTNPPGIICQMTGKDLDCNANFGSFNLKAEMGYLSNTLSGDQKNFETLIIRQTNIEELPENAFLDISFDYIEIFDTQNFKRIHTNAFNNNTVLYLKKQIYISLPSKLRNDPPDYDLWKALSSLANVVDIDISLDDGSHEIPDNAFQVINGPQNNLLYMVFEPSNYTISRIGNNAFFELPNFSVLSFRGIPIVTIATNAFDFKTNSENPLTINFENCSLTESSFEEAVFSNANRPLTLELSMISISIITCYESYMTFIFLYRQK